MVSIKKATQQNTRQHNRDLVLKLILANEAISRAEIARVTQLTRTTVSDVVAGLIIEGLVEEVGPGSSIGGKPSIMLRLVADSRYLIGLNLAFDKFIASVVNLRGEFKETIEIPIRGNISSQALQMVYQILDQLLSKAWQPIVGIGVGAPGLINMRDGVVVNAVNLEWRNFPLGRYLEERYRLPVSVINDSQATAIGEFVYGRHETENNMVVINLKNGIGAGLLINGQLFSGDGGYAGEIGHVCAQENGQLCRCGRRGCLETVASTQAVVQRVQALSQPGVALSLEDVLQKFNMGDSLTRRVVDEAGHCLGTAIGSLAGTLNIKTIVLSGDMTRFGPPWLEAVRSALQQSVIDRLAQETRLIVGNLDFRACILGASAHLLLGNYSLLFQKSEN